METGGLLSELSEVVATAWVDQHVEYGERCEMALEALHEALANLMLWRRMYVEWSRVHPASPANAMETGD